MANYANFASHVGLRVNYSLYAVPVAWTVAMAPLWWAVAAAGSVNPNAYDQSEPAESWASLEKSGASPQLAKRIRRAVAANNNGLTNLSIFASCLVAANFAKVPVRFLHICAGTYLTSRSLYNLAYMFIEDPKVAYARTLCFFGGVGSCFALVIKAAEQIRNSPY
ncbi:uncharacterized protein MKK02DRAFT_39532 [Dioszegia hungarica]|uniref:Uncharacterized protein n=1 Tax=Dioszegia hungarica TaxID=4972 RepID=A0AA38LWX3_9TREE|nr:uncharacterized protein MKK02DRAFT_39532 [Dioszegia hungarica]KAI9639237.1 hypothetical protein MKK02DRAFT_39532 [Dioszegia hungarica]